MAPPRADLGDQACGPKPNGGKIAPARARLAMPRRTHLPSENLGERCWLSSAIEIARWRKGLNGDADPCDIRTYNAKAVEIRFGFDGLCLPLGEGARTAGVEKHRDEE